MNAVCEKGEREMVEKNSEKRKYLVRERERESERDE
jgi:hypothetical protein